jgi:hypothetical protein
LTLGSWITVKGLATENIKLEPAGTGAIEGALAQIKAPVAKLKKDGIEPRLAALSDLDSILAKYVPATKDDEGKKTMAGIVKIFRSKVAAQATAVQTRRDKLSTVEDALKDPEERKQELAKPGALVAEMQRLQGEIATFTFDDELDDMLETSDAAESLLKEVTPEMRKDREIGNVYHDFCQAQCEFLIRIRYKTQDVA